MWLPAFDLVQTMYKRVFLISGLLGLMFLFACEKQNPASLRQTTQLSTGWEFTRESEPAVWKMVTLPHTANVEPLVVNNQWQGTSWYRRTFTVDDLTTQKHFLRFEGVMHEADVQVNGQLLRHHTGGYLPFVVEITDALVPGDNTLEVKVDNRNNPDIPPGKPLETLDFTYYGGIYRDVQLISTSQVYITDALEVDKVGGGGLFVHFTDISDEKAKGTVDVTVKNGSTENLKVHFVATFRLGEQVKASASVKEVDIPAGGVATLPGFVEIPAPALWSVTDPNLYTVDVVLYSNGRQVDGLQLTTGIRKVELREDGFYLNNQKLFIRGTNRHQEYPYVGYAISDNAQYRDALKIKNAGFDFVRLSHYPQDEAFLDACDELGLIVMDAIPGWQWFKEDGDFVQHSFRDIREMVRRDRNHPSVVFWENSLNESGMSPEYMAQANLIVKEELPFADIFTAGWIDHPTYDVYIPARQHGRPPEYWNHYKEGKRPVFISEYGDWEYYAQNAGFNQKAFQDLKEEERTSRQLRRQGEKALLQQALNFQEAANSNRKGAGTIGHANWVMFDYNRGYADDIEASGISDIFRLPKFAYYFYQSQRPVSELLDIAGVQSGPMVKIASHWTEGSSPNVTVFSNCDEVALYLDDSLILRQKPERDALSSHLNSPPYHVDMGSFRPGVLRAEGYAFGEVVARDQVATHGAPYSIRLEVETSGIPIHTSRPDVVFVYASVVDKQGNPVPGAEYPIQFHVSGNAELVGQNPIVSEAGIAAIVLATQNRQLPVTITAEAGGLEPAQVTVSSSGQ